MKVIDKRKPQTTTFGELKVGDVFSICGSYYMRVENILDEDGDVYNTVLLSKGCLDFWSDGAEVQKVNATLIIGDNEE